jgi:hypothetical protein
MNIRTELIALAVRAISEKTNLVPKPDAFSEFFAVFTTGKTYDQRVAESLEASALDAVTAVKKMNVNRKFKKIIQHI